MGVELKVDQVVNLTWKAKRKDGSDAPIDGMAEWSLEGESVEISPDEEGTLCGVKALKPGVSVVTLEADADMGDSVRAIKTSITVEVLEDEADSILIEVGKIQDGESQDDGVPPMKKA